MSRILKVDPQERITLGEIQDDLWFCAEQAAEDIAEMNSPQLIEAEVRLLHFSLPQPSSILHIFSYQTTKLPACPTTLIPVVRYHF